MIKPIKSFLFILLVIFLCKGFDLYAQISYGGKPVEFPAKLKSGIPIIEMPGFDINKMLEEDERNKFQIKPYRFAKVFTVELDMTVSGKWDYLDDGSKVCRLEIHSPGAYSINLIFSKFKLPIGARLFVYNKDKSFILGGFTYKNNKTNKIFPVSPVEGDVLIMEYQEPEKVTGKPELMIGKIGHDYRNIFDHFGIKQYQTSGSCNVDINCPAGENWQKEKLSIWRYVQEP